MLIKYQQRENEIKPSIYPWTDLFHFLYQVQCLVEHT